MKKKNIYLQWFIIFMACSILITFIYRQKNIYFNHKFEFDNSGWKDGKQIFFPAKNTKYYDIILKIQYNELYEFSNLFIKYIIKDLKNGNIYKEEIREYQLFEKLTGNPFGKGFLNKKTLTVLLAKKIKFPITSKYSLTLKHYMRKKSLKGIEKIIVKIYES